MRTVMVSKRRPRPAARTRRCAGGHAGQRGEGSSTLSRTISTPGCQLPPARGSGLRLHEQVVAEEEGQDAAGSERARMPSFRSSASIAPTSRSNARSGSAWPRSRSSRLRREQRRDLGQQQPELLRAWQAERSGPGRRRSPTSRAITQALDRCPIAALQEQQQLLLMEKRSGSPKMASATSNDAPARRAQPPRRWRLLLRGAADPPACSPPSSDPTSTRAMGGAIAPSCTS